MYHPTAGFLPSSRSQFPSYLPAARPTSSDSPAQVSPLVTPNGSFETLRNFSPPLPAPPSNQYAQYMMPMQHVELLQQMWGPAQPATSTPPILMSQQDTGWPQTSLEEQLQRDLEEDRKDAEREMQRYEEAALLDSTAECTADIVRFWEQKEHIFSASQWMSFPRRPRLSLPNEFSRPAKRHAQIGVLTSHQLFSKLYKQGRLNFTSHLIAEEVDYSISGPVSRNAIDELMAAGKLDELAQLLANENEDHFST